MRLGDLLNGIYVLNEPDDLDCEIKGLHYDSRLVLPGYLFVCVKGLKTDGHLYVPSALSNGAVAVLCESDIAVQKGISMVKTDNTRKALAMAAQNFYRHPSRCLRLIGVTGTNGKTTTAHLVQAILEQWSKKVGILGTLYAKIGENIKELGHTTPEAIEINDFLRESVAQKADYTVMEVSSHALALERVAGLDFDAAVFTNLTQDHLDYHADMKDYKEAKLKLFSMVAAKDRGYVVVNRDDPYADDFINICPERCITYGIDNKADIQGFDLHTSLQGSSFRVKTGESVFKVDMRLIGRFSIYNALAAITVALQEGVPAEIIAEALRNVKGVPGRFEQVTDKQDFTVVVDYAHTPDGLENILKTAQDIVENRIITVFGCGGDRDRTKRPLMGKIAGTYSGFSIVTSDNPRYEEPEDIIEDILPGLSEVEDARYAIIPDRREAIRHAIYLARSGDLIIIAGKGHENYQLVKDRVLSFDDRLVASEFLKGRENNEI